MNDSNEELWLQKGKRIVLVLYSGGDAPGMNMHLRAMVRIGANRHQATVVGVKDGFLGLVRTCRRLQRGDITLEKLRYEMEGFPGRYGLARRTLDLVCLDHASVQGLAGQGGIVLGAARCRAFHDLPQRKQAIDLLECLRVSVVVVVGGDGSLTGARRLAVESSVQVLAVPATIDNDLPCTERALGFDTAVQNAVGAVEHCNDTAGAHHRILVVQTMGRSSGQLAQAAALAAGAEITVVPERGILDSAKMDGIARRLERSMLRGRDHAIVVVAEGVTTEPPTTTDAATALGAYLEQRFTAEGEALDGPPERPCADVRVCSLGYLQRGGRPVASDRILAARFAGAAWRLISAPARRSGVLVLQQGRIRLRPFDETDRPLPLEPNNEAEPALDLYDTAKAISAW